MAERDHPPDISKFATMKMKGVSPFDFVPSILNTVG